MGKLSTSARGFARGFLSLSLSLVWNLVAHIQTFAYLQTARNSGLVLWKMPSELVWKILSATESLMPMVMLMPVCRVVFGGDSVWKSHRRSMAILQRVSGSLKSATPALHHLPFTFWLVMLLIIPALVMGWSLGPLCSPTGTAFSTKPCTLVDLHILPFQHLSGHLTKLLL